MRLIHLFHVCCFKGKILISLNWLEFYMYFCRCSFQISYKFLNKILTFSGNYHYNISGFILLLKGDGNVIEGDFWVWVILFYTYVAAVLLWSYNAGIVMWEFERCSLLWCLSLKCSFMLLMLINIVGKVLIVITNMDLNLICRWWQKADVDGLHDFIHIQLWLSCSLFTTRHIYNY